MATLADVLISKETENSGLYEIHMGFKMLVRGILT
jgi:hypothetical protein